MTFPCNEKDDGTLHESKLRLQIAFKRIWSGLIWKKILSDLRF